MSQSYPEAQDAQQAPGLQSNGIDPIDSAPSAMARYTIHVPVKNRDKEEIPHVLQGVRKAMTTLGFEGRIVIRRAQGDWQDFDTEEVDLVMTDAPDDPGTQAKIAQIATGAKQLAGVDAIYVTKQPITTILV